MVKQVASYTRRQNGQLRKVKGYNIPSNGITLAEKPDVTPAKRHRDILRTVERGYPALKEKGKWPDYITPTTLTGRVPTPTEPGYGGFDAGIACSLGLIPEHKQTLAATLHAAYTPQAIQQIRDERQELDPDSETAWWAAACWVCQEGKVDWEDFNRQIQWFQDLASDSDKRLDAAVSELAEMTESFELVDGVPFSRRDGGIIGAYIQGHDFGVAYAEDYGIYFVSTYHQSLGLPSDFEWENDVTETMSQSGPVHGSLQYVKAASESELKRILGSTNIIR